MISHKSGGVKTGCFILHLPPVEVGHNFAALFCKFWHVHFVGQWWYRKVSCESFLIFYLINENYCDNSRNLFQLPIHFRFCFMQNFLCILPIHVIPNKIAFWYFIYFYRYIKSNHFGKLKQQLNNSIKRILHSDLLEY